MLKILAYLGSIGNAPNRTGPWAHSTPIAVSPVLARSQEILSASVIWVLIEQPVSIKHIAGMDVVVVKTVIQRWAVVSKLHHLTAKVRMLVDSHSVRSLMLEVENICRLTL